jgi:hypothetical protein
MVGIAILQRAKFDVTILEASSRVGGRVITFRDPVFAPGLHAEGGAMRISKNHYLLHEYINRSNIDSLFNIEMKNKFIYISNYRGGTTLTYDDFNAKLVSCDHELLELFPGLKHCERGKTCDDLFFEAIEPVVSLFKKTYNAQSGVKSAKIRAGYQQVTEVYDRYTLRGYLEQVLTGAPTPSICTISAVPTSSLRTASSNLGRTPSSRATRLGEKPECSSCSTGWTRSQKPSSLLRGSSTLLKRTSPTAPV